MRSSRSHIIKPEPAYASFEVASRRWRRLCTEYLPIRLGGGFWRGNRNTRADEPTQGWKLHVSATAPQACDVLEAVAPFLTSRGVRFKAPESLTSVVELNAGLKHRYTQVGKIITVYPDSSADAVEMAGELDRLTRGFIPLAVPFDNQYRPGSNVFYRYGRFVDLKATGRRAIQNASGELVYDDNRTPVPEWISDPFPKHEPKITDDDARSPLTTRYAVLDAITQRGKGGTYRAIDFSTTPPRPCVIKQGRRFGEQGWEGHDGFALVKRECDNMIRLGSYNTDIPAVLDSFESGGDFYVVMEYIDGASLHRLMMTRRRRFSILQIVSFAIEAATIIEKINNAGWIWNDCKPGNLIVTKSGHLRPVDFENAHPAGASAPFNWTSRAYSNESAPEDAFALGATIYLLLTGTFYDRETQIPVSKFRRNVPSELMGVVDELLHKDGVSISSIRKRLERVRRSLQVGAPS